jgi:hypothetical protein
MVVQRTVKSAKVTSSIKTDYSWSCTIILGRGNTKSVFRAVLTLYALQGRNLRCHVNFTALAK